MHLPATWLGYSDPQDNMVASVTDVLRKDES